MERPIVNTYWVEPGRLLAGQYPGVSPEKARKKIRALIDGGITTFIDLTHPDDGLDPYALPFRTCAERADLTWTATSPNCGLWGTPRGPVPQR